MSDGQNDPKSPGVAESGALFSDATAEDRWAITRARYEEHVRTGAATLSVEEVGELLRSEIARLRAERAGPGEA